ncbi:MAG: multicopper oxidase family protein [Aestuariivirga sp.]
MRFSRRDVLRLSAALPFAPSALAAVPSKDLTVHSRILEVKRKPAKVFGISGPSGKPGLELIYGEPFEVDLHNGLQEPTTIHWHGLTPPTTFDGVPGLSAAPLRAGETRRYKFANKRTGTHWMHSHLGLQEQQLLAAPLIVRETEKPVFDEQEHVVMLHDFTFRDPAEILAELKGGGGGHAMHMKMDRSKMSTMKMDGMAMGSDVTFDALLANDRTLDDPEIVSVDKGGTLHLRLINAAAATNMWVDLGTLKGQLISVDGNAVKPVVVTRFPLAIAQRADVRITLPNESSAWPVLFQSEGASLRCGVVLKVGDGAAARISDQGAAGEALGLEFEAALRVPYELKKAKVSQREMVMLTGGDDGYQWGFNGKPMMHDVLFRVKFGTRVELTMHNMTAMAHPMHLHGHYFQVTAINGQAFEGALRDTVLIPPDNMVSVEFDADNPGTWAFHCHHLYHMNSGMMAAMAYA